MDELVEKMAIINPLGLHARPAASLVQAALRFESEIYVELDGRRVNAKSIMGLLTLAAAEGTVLKVICKGPDAAQAMAALRDVIAAGFGEI